MSRTSISRLGWVAVALLGMAGCSEIDPLTKEGTWHPTGANDANLRAMVAVPSDLAFGRSARTADGEQAARAVDRLRSGRVYPLQSIGTSKVGQISSGAPATPAQAEP